MQKPHDLTAGKRAVAAHLHALLHGARPASVFASDAELIAAHPWGHRKGPEDCAELYRVIAGALDHVTRRADILIAGTNAPDARVSVPRFSPLVGWLGTVQGLFVGPLLGIAPTGRAVHLRIAEVHHLNADGRILRSWVIPDLLDLMDQSGQWPAALPRPPGGAGLWPGPLGGSGVRLDMTDPEEGSRSLAGVLAMHEDLHRFDGHHLETMPMNAWAPGFAYYAGGGIGICKGLESFRAHHQQPFLSAFPDRRGAGHFVRIGDGAFALTGGQVAVTHSGSYLGVPPTGRELEMMVMDFYRFDADGLIAENWLPIDMPGLLAAMGQPVAACALN